MTCSASQVTHYGITLPRRFLLTQLDVDVSEIGSHEENGETWQLLQVRFPSPIPTHNAEQPFYFNQKGLLQRSCA